MLGRPSLIGTSVTRSHTDHVAQEDFLYSPRLPPAELAALNGATLIDTAENLSLQRMLCFSVTAAILR